MNREELDLYIEKYLIKNNKLNMASVQHGKLKKIKHDLISFIKINNITELELLYLYHYKLKPYICPICNKTTKFINFANGYRKHCSSKCAQKNIKTKNKIKATNLQKYGVEYGFQSEEIKNKIKQIKLDKYGNKNYNNSKKIIQTNLQKYGVKYGLQSKEVIEKKKATCLKNNGVKYPSQSETIKENIKQTCLKNYGVENPSQSEEIKQKKIDTCMKNYGVKYPSQDPTIHQKQLSTFGRKMQLKAINENLHYQSIPELNFIHFCQSNNIEIWDGPSIPYFLDGKKHIYHIDFETLEWVVEIKSSHGWYYRDIESGKIGAKNSAAEEYAGKIGKEFRFLLDIYIYG